MMNAHQLRHIVVRSTVHCSQEGRNMTDVSFSQIHNFIITKRCGNVPRPLCACGTILFAGKNPSSTHTHLCASYFLCNILHKIEKKQT